MMSVLNLIVCILAIVVAFTAFFGLALLGDDANPVILGAALAAIVVVNMLYQRCVYIGYFRILTERCDTDEYVSKIRRRIKSSLSNSVTYLNMQRLYLGLGLYYQGAFEEMGRVLDGIAENPKLPRLGKAMFMQMKLLLALQNGRIESAKDEMAALEVLLSGCKESDALRLKDIAQHCGFLLRLKQGETADAEEYLNRRLEKAQKRLAKVTATYLLADIYGRDGQTEKAASALEYVIQNGNKLYIASAARRQLEQLQGLA
jgi:tetratricopeptide (TPR) repeat protein